MSIDLTGMPIARAVPAQLRFGGVLTPPTGGPRQYIDRLGSRWSFQFDTPWMRIEPNGRRWGSLLRQAQREGGILPISFRGDQRGAPGSPTVGADTLTGRTVPIVGGTPRHSVKLGSFVSIIHDGRRYLDQVVEQAILDDEGAGSLHLLNLIRVPLTAGDAVDLGWPKIEGRVETDIGGAWEVDGLTSFSFTITEDE